LKRVTSEDEIKQGLRQRTIASEIVPMLCGTAFKNKGVQAMLDAVIDYMPSPVDIPPVKGADEDEQTPTRKADDGEKFSALAFKLMTDPFVGQLTFVRVYSGVLKSRATPSTTRSRARRSASAVSCRCTPTTREEIDEIRAGDIAACVGLKDVTTGETLCDPDSVITLERMVFPEPVISQAVEPKTKADQEKMGIALGAPGPGRPVVPGAHRRRIRPDHHLGHGRAAPRNHRRPHEARVRRRGQRGQAAGGLPRNHPQAGREAEGKFVQAVRRQGPVRPRRAQDRAELPPAGKGFEFVDAIKGGVVPREFIPAVEKGINEAVTPACWPVTRWSMSRSRCTSVRTTTWTRTNWRSRWPPSFGFKEGMRRPARCCSSR
jgi:elongation factor G